MNGRAATRNAACIGAISLRQEFSPLVTLIPYKKWLGRFEDEE